jgi:hypothetical protein
MLLATVVQDWHLESAIFNVMETFFDERDNKYVSPEYSRVNGKICIFKKT